MKIVHEPGVPMRELPQSNICVDGHAFPYTQSGLSSAISTAQGASTVYVPRGRIKLTSPLSVSSNARIYWDGVTLASLNYSGDLVDLANVADVSFGGKLILDGAGSGSEATSQGLNLTRVVNFIFDEIEVKSVINSCVQILGSSFVSGNKIHCAHGDRGSGSSSAAIFIANDGPVATTDVTVNEISVNGQPNSDCLYLSDNYRDSSGKAKRNERIDIRKIDLLSCGDSGFELDHTSGNFGEVAVARDAVENSAVLIRSTTDDNINSVICAGGFKLCVDVATFATQDSEIDGVTIGQIIARDVNTDEVNGAAVRVSSNGPAAISDVLFGSIVASDSTRGFYCAGSGAGGGPAQHILVNNLIVYHEHREGVWLWGCNDVMLDNVLSYDNGQKYHGSPGIRGSSATDIVLGNVRVFDDQSSKTQDYGILTDGTSDRWTIGNADIRDDLETKSGMSLTGSNNIVVRRTGPSGAVELLGKAHGFSQR